MNEFNVEIGRRIRETREMLKITRENLSGMTGISDKFIYDIEVGKKSMKIKTLFKLAIALEISLDLMLNDTDVENLLYRQQPSTEVSGLLD